MVVVLLVGVTFIVLRFIGCSLWVVISCVFLFLLRAVGFSGSDREKEVSRWRMDVCHFLNMVTGSYSFVEENECCYCFRGVNQVCLVSCWCHGCLCFFLLICRCHCSNDLSSRQFQVAGD